MSRGASGSSSSRAEAYAPQRRTALVLSGIGTAGVYHAGVLRALHEAGVKLDVVAARGIGVVGALFTAIDGARRLWDSKGFWRAPAVADLYPWSPVLRLFVWAACAAAVLVAVPLMVVAAGLIVFPIDFVLGLAGVTSTRSLDDWYLSVTQAAFAPGGLPTWLPRLVVLVLGTAVTVALVGAWRGAERRRLRGPLWWRLLPPALSTTAAVSHCWTSLWDLLRGAARLKEPPPVELGRRYTELLTENLGQPGFRELLIAVHDLDIGRDLVFALVGEARRRDLLRRSTTREAEARKAELIDLTSVSRDHFADALAASLTIPLATEPHVIHFAAEEYWRGESHRLCDRPGSLIRLLEELALLDVAQVILVSAAPEAPGPHALSAPRLDGRGRVGEYLQSSEAALIRDLSKPRSPSGLRVFTIRPAHNPIGPFDFAGGFDDRSDRKQPLGELMSRGYEDAYQQFIEPVVGASGERVG
jgi:predicted acylesterase/phospholipase RssA